MTRPKRALHPGERGSITVFFCIFALILVGAVSYSLYVGQQVERRINLQNTSDAAAVSMANHGSVGLNMISGNNLAIGASIHISGSVVILTSYLSIVRALTYGVADVASDALAAVTSNTSKIQGDMWDRMAMIPFLYMRTASGLTSFNQFLRDYWLLPAPIRSIELARLNVPGSVTIPIQKLRKIPGITNYAGIKQSSPKDTMCHAIKSSEGLGMAERDSISAWLQGPLLTLNGIPGMSTVNTILDVASKIETAVLKISTMHLGFVNCGYGLNSKLFDALKKLSSISGDDILTAPLTIPTINSAFDAVQRGCEDFIHKTVLGVCIPLDPRYAAYKAAFPTAKAVAIAKAVPDADFRKRVILAQTIAKMKDKGKLMSCQALDPKGHEVGAPKVNHVAVLDASGATNCLSVDEIAWYCPMKDDLKIPLFPQHNDPIDAACKGYENFEKNSSSGISIASWGAQAERYAQGDAGRADTLGFLHPDGGDLQKFEDSITFINAVTSPLRVMDDYDRTNMCPDGFATTVDGKMHCETSPMVGFSNLFQKSTREAMQGKKKLDNEQINLMSGGLNTLITKESSDASKRVSALDGSLDSTFSRVQWVASQAQAKWVKGDNDPTNAPTTRLFWPAWRSRLQPVSLLGDLFNAVAGGSASLPALQQGAALDTGT